MLKQVWQGRGFNKNAKIEKHILSNGEITYTFRDRQGRPFNVETKADADEIIKNWRLVDVTEEYRKDGWIL